MRIKNVFLIDDDVVFTFIVSKMIERTSFCENLLVFHSCEEVLEILSNNAQNNNNLPDVLLVDINLPIMDGFEFLMELNEIILAKQPIIYLFSSSTDPADLRKSELFPCIQRPLTKPLGMDEWIELKTEIETLLLKR